MWKAWDWFWFHPQRPEAIAFLRILSGAMLVYTTIVWGIKLEAFFGPHGYQDPLLVQSQLIDSTALSFWWWVPTEHLRLAHNICLAILTLYVLGVFTRITSWLAFLICISYANRAVDANFGLDQINAFLTFYCAIGDSGGTFSVDRLWKRYRTGLRSLKLRGVWKPNPVAASVATRVATRLVQIHMCCVYLWAGFGKLKGTTWWDGRAFWYALSNGEYKTHDLLWVAWHPWISDIVTHVTIIWEVTFIALIWVPALRPWILLMGVLMHLGIGGFMGLWTFGLIMIFAYTMYFPPELYQRIFTKLWNSLPALGEREVVVDQSNRASLSTASWIKAWDPTDRIALLVQGQSSEVVPQVKAIYSIADWWREVRKAPEVSWPFVTTDRLQGERLRLVLLANQNRRSLELQDELTKHGFECRLAVDVVAACSMLSVRPADAVVMLLTNREDVADYRAFRQLLLCGGEEAPTSVLVLGTGQKQDNVWRNSEEHRIVAGGPVTDEIVREVTSSWGEAFPKWELGPIPAGKLKQKQTGKSGSRS
ncbi:MAG: hypothetical protein KDA80_18195 [Planctomycetaceae bacterium]|nr:hypothetical protein [Planctomycetaceae bacterium]